MILLQWLVVALFKEDKSQTGQVRITLQVYQDLLRGQGQSWEKVGYLSPIKLLAISWACQIFAAPASVHSVPSAFQNVSFYPPGLASKIPT